MSSAIVTSRVISYIAGDRRRWPKRSSIVAISIGEETKSRFGRGNGVNSHLDFSERDEQAALELRVEAQDSDGLLEVTVGGGERVHTCPDNDDEGGKN
jgi:hypothetical protein